MKTIPLKIGFLGATNEVGRAAIAVKTAKAQVLLDYGVMINHEPGFPMHVPPKEVDAIILTHCHLDHSGAIPIYHIHEKKPVYGTKLTFELTQVLIEDFIHLSGYYLPYEYLELKTMLRSCRNLKYRKEREIGDIKFQLLNAGHVPGSAQILLEVKDKRILYTSDFNPRKTRLLDGADQNYGELDVVIIESTYADEDHPDRAQMEKEFVNAVTEVVERGGTALVPAFSVGRAQEILCILAAHHFEYSVTLDGMAREVCRIMMNNTKFLRDPRLFLDAVHMANWVEGWKDRRKATKKPGVIVSPAGMLKGGPAAFYIQKVGKKSHNAVFLVSYQIPGTPGRELLEKGMCVIDGKVQKVKAEVRHFDFSSHAGASELKETIKKLEGNPKVFVVHGAEGNCEMFANWIRENIGLEASAPEAGETLKI
ncbi:MBL fold metallo-hydrolase [Candidatus Bathyarchaeota archaeon]|nr:MBL fold metallo-hydrolase [Candidatus Bathyarchaeota archaeon]